MKKKYSLDYSIQRDTDRLKAIEDILDQLDTNPSPPELEQMASYILYGKDENGKNAVQRGETTDTDKRYATFKRTEDKNKSLDEILDNPLNDQLSLQPVEKRYIYTKKTTQINRPKYDKKTGECIDEGDMNVPGMQQLWERIDYLEHVIAVNEGLAEPDNTVTIMKDSYRLYQLKHMVADLRRHQYYLKDSHNPPIHFLALPFPQPQTINWDSDGFYWTSYADWKQKVTNSYLSSISKNLVDYETRKNPHTGEIEVKWIVQRHVFNWENPKHIRALIEHYARLFMETREKLHCWGRTLIYDFDRYFDMCHFSPAREYILTRKIDGANYQTICNELRENFQLNYNETHLCIILTKEIPEKMAKMAKRTRLLIEWPAEDYKCCFTCKQKFPRHPLFFSRNRGRKDGFSSNCKECDRKRRIARGEQGQNDRRNKETKMLEMQARKTRA